MGGDQKGRLRRSKPGGQVGLVTDTWESFGLNAFALGLNALVWGMKIGA
jgi:hypothetical protein